MRASSLVWLFVLVGGCSSKPSSDQPPRGISETKPSDDVTETPARKSPPPRLFDADGKLYASDEYAGGIAMPAWVELFRADELTRVYRIRAPIDKVLAYFGPRLITGNVKRVGDGAVYKRASVKGAEMNPTKIDVSILEVGSNLVLIEILELPPPPEYAPSPTETKSAARDHWRKLD